MEYDQVLMWAKGWRYNLFYVLFSFNQTWPEDALHAVATRFLSDVELLDHIRSGCIDMCQKFHLSTQLLSEQFKAELDRHNYVTPTSYLELIRTFKTLLDVKRK